jgi:hypothetical protein
MGTQHETDADIYISPHHKVDIYRTPYGLAESKILLCIETHLPNGWLIPGLVDEAFQAMSTVIWVPTGDTAVW